MFYLLHYLGFLRIVNPETNKFIEIFKICLPHQEIVINGLEFKTLNC